MTDRDDILRKIAAMLALADPDANDNEAERAVAAARAQGLILKYRIEMHEIEGSQRRQLPGIRDVIIGSWPMGRFWMQDLLKVVGDPVAVTTYYFPQGPARREVHLVGRPDVIAYVELVSNWIGPQLARECEVQLAHRKRIADDEWRPWGPGDTIRFRRSFYTAATGRIGERLRESIQGEPGMELVLSDRKEVDDYNESIGIRTKRHKRQWDRDAMHRGESAANRADIDPRNKVSGGKRQELPA